MSFDFKDTIHDVTAMHSWTRKLAFDFVPTHPGVKENERPDSLAGTTTITDGISMGRADILTALITAMGFLATCIYYTPGIQVYNAYPSNLYRKSSGNILVDLTQE